MSPTALVTGGASGIGAALARRLAADGHDVLVADVDAAAAGAVTHDCGGRALPTDVTRPEELAAAVEAARDEEGALDVLCLNAGVATGTSLGAGFDEARYRRAMAVNVDGPVLGLQAALPALSVRGGAVLVTSSLAGLAGAEDALYAAAKHFLVGLVRSAAAGLGERRVTVNALCPGFVDTPLMEEGRDALARLGLAVAAPSDVADAAAEVLASGRTGGAWEIQAGRPPVVVDPPAIELARVSPGA